MANSVYWISLCVLLSCVIPTAVGKHPEQSYISEWCQQQMVLDECVLLGVHNGSQPLDTPYSCDVVVQGGQLGDKLILKVTSLDMSSPCSTSKLTLRNSDGTFFTGQNGICGTSAPSTAYYTNGQYAWIHFEINTTAAKKESFEIIITSFRSELPNGNCPNATEMYKCPSGRCIARDLKCDGYDNCGDNSDEDDCVGLSKLDFTLIGIGAGLLLVFAVSLTMCLLVSRVRKRRNYEKMVN